MSGRRVAEVEAALADARELPELDQYLAAMHEWASALDELDELGPLVPWRPRRLLRARRLLRSCEHARHVAELEKRRLSTWVDS